MASVAHTNVTSAEVALEHFEAMPAGYVVGLTDRQRGTRTEAVSDPGQPGDWPWTTVPIGHLCITVERRGKAYCQAARVVARALGRAAEGR